MGLRLPPDLLERLNEKAAAMNINRSALIVIALNAYLDDAPAAAPAIPSGAGSTADESARKGLLMLKERLDAVESELKLQSQTLEELEKLLADNRHPRKQDDEGDDFLNRLS